MSKNELQKHHVVHQLYHKCFELWTLSTSTVFFLFISFFKEYHSLPEEYRCWRMCSILAITEIFNGLQWMEFSWGHCSNRWPPLFHNVNQDEIYANETSGLYFISNSAEKIGLLAGITFDIFTITVYLRCNTLISNETNRNLNTVRKLHVGWLWCDIPIKQLELANFHQGKWLIETWGCWMCNRQ